MVAVKDRDELTFGIFQRIIDVAGLGVPWLVRAI